ncbi:MAG TPA: M50 family metallopeptidase [Chthonomonadales bacterium]|nr:M50 family metallopeptidase [Chthonomonadales bacterium]
MSDNLTIRSASLQASRGGQANARSLLLLATAASLAVWFVPYGQLLLYPLRLFVTFVHESGHALAAVLVGGSVVSLTVHPDTSGVTFTRESPLWAWFVLSGGYLGAALFGALMLQVARIRGRRNGGRLALYIVGGAVLAITLLWAHNPIKNGFTLAMGLFLAAVFYLAARFASPRTADFLASFLAVQCCMDALIDLKDLVYITQNNLGDSDARFMSQQYGLPPTFWAITWAVIAILIMAISLRAYLRATAVRRRA